jgi:hypothetical protein
MTQISGPAVPLAAIRAIRLSAPVETGRVTAVICQRFVPVQCEEREGQSMTMWLKPQQREAVLP